MLSGAQQKAVADALISKPGTLGRIYYDWLIPFYVSFRTFAADTALNMARPLVSGHSESRGLVFAGVPGL